VHIETRELARAIARAAYARKAEDLVYLDLTGRASYCDGFLICSGTNRRQVNAIAEGIASDLREIGQRPIGVEGMEAARWVLLDFGDILVHVFDGPMRGFYDLEALWVDARRVTFDDEQPKASAGAAASARV
jgi:ribosome-associated protein